MTMTISSASSRPCFGSMIERAVEPLAMCSASGRRGSGRGAARTARRRTRRRRARPADLAAPVPRRPSIAAGVQPWKWIVCGWTDALTNVIRRPLALAARSVGPGSRRCSQPERTPARPRSPSRGDQLPLAHDPAARRAPSRPRRSRGVIAWGRTLAGVSTVRGTSRACRRGACPTPCHPRPAAATSPPAMFAVRNTGMREPPRPRDGAVGEQSTSGQPCHARYYDMLTTVCGPPRCARGAPQFGLPGHRNMNVPGHAA
jgi:hypothetical protein